eukprot:gene43619-41375_t
MQIECEVDGIPPTTHAVWGVDGIVFNSCFDSGNLARVERVEGVPREDGV